MKLDKQPNWRDQYENAYQILARVDRQIQALQSQAIGIMMRVPAPPGGRWPFDPEMRDATIHAANRALEHWVFETARECWGMAMDAGDTELAEKIGARFGIHPDGGRV